MNTDRKKVILTGAPGTGKSTLLHALSHRFEVATEVSRPLIRYYQKRNQTIAPWGDVEKFVSLALERMIHQCDHQQSEVCVYDRSIPDLIVALRYRGRSVDPAIYRAIKTHLAGSLVFFAPPWKAIYVSDEQRPESFEQTLQMSRLTREVYDALGFQMVLLKRESPRQRAQQVIRMLLKQRQEAEEQALI